MPAEWHGDMVHRGQTRDIKAIDKIIEIRIRFTIADIILFGKLVKIGLLLGFTNTNVRQKRSSRSVELRLLDWDRVVFLLNRGSALLVDKVIDYLPNGIIAKISNQPPKIIKDIHTENLTPFY